MVGFRVSGCGFVPGPGFKVLILKLGLWRNDQAAEYNRNWPGSRPPTAYLGI